MDNIEEKYDERVSTCHAEQRNRGKIGSTAVFNAVIGIILY